MAAQILATIIFLIMFGFIITEKAPRHLVTLVCAAATLLLVFGGSLGTWVLDYVYDLPFLQLLNSNSLDIVIMQGLSGGIGVILTVPLAAGFSAVLLCHHREPAAQAKQAKSPAPDI